MVFDDPILIFMLSYIVVSCTILSVGAWCNYIGLVVSEHLDMLSVGYLFRELGNSNTYSQTYVVFLVIFGVPFW